MSTTTTRRAEMYARIEEHGRNLLAVFPGAVERDPVELCRKLRRLETKAAALALRLCNGPEFPEGAYERQTDAVIAQVDNILGNNGLKRVPIFVNGDARGYSLKIRDEWLREEISGLRSSPASIDRAAALARIHKDWGGYGIIAPDLREGS